LRRTLRLVLILVLLLSAGAVTSSEAQTSTVQVAILHGKVVYFGPGQPEKAEGSITYVSAAAPTAPRGQPGSGPNCIPPCGSNELIYQEFGGTVQYGGTYAYNIFWEPPGSGVNYSSYNADNNALMSDENSTGYYGNLTQYYQQDSGGTHYIGNHSSLAGSYIDTSAFPSQTTSNGVTNPQIDAEVQSVISAKGWPQSLAYEYNVFLGVNPHSYQAETLSDGGCGDHGRSSLQSNVVDTAISYGGANNSVCAPPYCPHGCTIDAALATLAHETMETVTDTIPYTGWVDTSYREIIDKCEANQSLDYMDIVYDNNKANHFPGGPDYYLLESMWDNAEYGCAPYGPTYP